MASRPPSTISAGSYGRMRAAAGLSSKAVANAPVAKSYYAPSKPVINPFGAGVANEIFELWGEIEVAEQDCDDYGTYNVAPCSEEEYWYQTELPLESVRDLEERFRHEIKKFHSSYKKMMIYALQWHYLLEECEDNAQIEKMFNDMQMIRKLTGSEAV